MKKSFLLLPVSIAILTACSSNSPAPIENVDGTLSPGVMQQVVEPVDKSVGNLVVGFELPLARYCP